MLSKVIIDVLTNEVRKIGLAVYNEWSKPISVTAKADDTFVTQYDLQVQNELETVLPRILNVPIISEEKYSIPLPATCWIVDPIDGTAAFVAGIPTWAISIALLEMGMVTFGLIYFPVSNRLIHSEMDAAIFKSKKWVDQPKREDFILLPSSAHRSYSVSFSGKSRSLGSCCAQIYYSIIGQATFSLLGTPKLWDFAAGIPMIEAAGASLFSLSGEPVDVSKYLLNPLFEGSPLLIGPKGYEEVIRKFIHQTEPEG